MVRTFRTAGVFHRFMASLLTVAIAGSSAPANLLASTPPPGVAEIRGMILLPDGLTPVAGVTVKAANLETKQIYSSGKTGNDGVYSLASLPAGGYDLAVETAEGLYASDALVDVVAGKRQVVSLSIRPGIREGEEGEQAASGEEKKAEEAKSDEPASEPQPEPAKGKKKGRSFWRSPGGVAILIVGGAIVIGFAADSIVGDDDECEPMSACRRSN